MRLVALALLGACWTSTPPATEAPANVANPQPASPDAAIPTTVRARILHTELTNERRSILTIDKGAQHGITKHWTGCILEEENRCGADINVVRTEPTQSIVTVQRTIAELDPTGEVELFAPTDE